MSSSLCFFSLLFASASAGLPLEAESIGVHAAALPAEAMTWHGDDRTCPAEALKSEFALRQCELRTRRRRNQHARQVLSVAKLAWGDQVVEAQQFGPEFFARHFLDTICQQQADLSLQLQPRAPPFRTLKMA